MKLSYIIHAGNIVELIINNNIQNKYYIATLEDILKTNNILDPYSTLSFHSNFELQETSSTFININYIYFNKILIPILEKNGFIITPHANHKIFVYYVQHDEHTIELFFDNTSKRHYEFIILGTFLKYTLNTIRNNHCPDTEEGIFTMKISSSKHKISIQSKYLFKELPPKKLAGLPQAKNANSIIAFLKLNGFSLLEYPKCDVNQQPYFHSSSRLTPK